MIPTVLLLGLVLGGFVRDRHSLAWCSSLGAIASLLWGVLVGVADTSLATFVAGTGLAVVNFLVGAVVSVSVGGIARMVGPRKRPASRNDGTLR